MISELSRERVVALFPKRERDCHKGSFGRAVIIGGSMEYSGALKLAALAQSALRSGAGLCTLAVPSCIADGVLPYVLENTMELLPSKDGHLAFIAANYEKLIKNATSVAFGMGVGQHDENARILEFLLTNYEGRLLLDADGLNTLAKNMQLLDGKKPTLMMTPHPMEFSRLSGIAVEEVKKNPEELCEEFAKKWNATVLLKGGITYISNGSETIKNTRGSTGMAKGGSGDVLSGIIAGISAFAKDATPLEILGASAMIAGIAGEEATRKFGEYSMLASDEIKEIAFAIESLR